MSNTWGHHFRLTTAGESHGPAMVAIIDGCPAGLALNIDAIQRDLNRRRPGCSSQVTQRQEADQIKILSGVFRGQTTGMPIALMIENHDAKPKDYDELAHCYRPGHADWVYQQKYGIRDHRGGGRASARETAMWVAAGGVAKQVLAQHSDISVQAGLAQVGDIVAAQQAWDQVYQNDCYFLDAEQVNAVQALIRQLRRDGDSMGGLVKARVTGMPVGLGEPVFAKLDAQIAAALMGINAVKAVSIGDGFDVVPQRGSEHRDAMQPEGFASNHSGGVLGGISTGQDLIVSVAVKPPASIRLPVDTINDEGHATQVVTKGRHDVCVAIRAVPVVEAMLSLVLADAWLAHNTNRHCDSEQNESMVNARHCEKVNVIDRRGNLMTKEDSQNEYKQEKTT